MKNMASNSAEHDLPVGRDRLAWIDLCSRDRRVVVILGRLPLGYFSVALGPNGWRLLLFVVEESVGSKGFLRRCWKIGANLNQV